MGEVDGRAPGAGEAGEGPAGEAEVLSDAVLAGEEVTEGSGVGEGGVGVVVEDERAERAEEGEVLALIRRRIRDRLLDDRHRSELGVGERAGDLFVGEQGDEDSVAAHAVVPGVARDVGERVAGLCELVTES